MILFGPLNEGESLNMLFPELFRNVFKLLYITDISPLRGLGERALSL
jgi:hypothetical protein